MQKLIKLSDTHYIVVDDSKIQENDWYWTPIKRSIEQCVKKILVIKDGQNDVEQLKITHSTEPLDIIILKNRDRSHTIGNHYGEIGKLSLSEVEELINGYNVEKMAEQNNPQMQIYKNDSGLAKSAYIANHKNFIDGFNTHKELVKDKLFTMEDIKRAYEEGYYQRGTDSPVKDPLLYIQSLLTPTEWKVEFDETGKLKLV